MIERVLVFLTAESFGDLNAIEAEEAVPPSHVEGPDPWPAPSS
jgi:hypothetical protein